MVSLSRFFGTTRSKKPAPAHDIDRDAGDVPEWAIRDPRASPVASVLAGTGLFLNLLFIGWLVRDEVSSTTMFVWLAGSVAVSVVRTLALIYDDEHGDAPIVLAAAGAYGLWITWYWFSMGPMDDAVTFGFVMVSITLWWTASTQTLARDPVAFTILSLFLTVGPLASSLSNSSVVGGRIWWILVLLIAEVSTYVDRRRSFMRTHDFYENIRGLAAEVQLAFESSRDGVLVTNAGRVTRSNGAARGLLRRDAEDLQGRFLSEVFGPNHLLVTGSAVQIAITRQDGSGRIVEIEGRSYEHLDLDVWQLRDVTDQETRVRELRSLVESDELTGVANRRAMVELVAGALSLNRPVALLLVDVDNFKKINDRYGHAVGDRVLRGTVDRMVAAVGADGTVTRIGGDEFVVVMTEPGAIDRRREIAGRIVEASNAPLVVTREPLVVTISIGISHTDGSKSMNPERLIELADRAMYRAKKAGRSGWRDASSDDEPSAGA